MSKMATFMNRILAVGAVAGMLASCTSSKIGLVNTPPANPSVAATAPAAPADESAPAAAQGAPATEAYASSAENVATVATETAVSPLEKATREQAATATAKGQTNKLSGAKRAIAKVLVKKLEKAQKKFDIKKEKAQKAGKADPTVRTGIIIAVVGLGILLVGAIVNSALLYGLGSLGIVVGLVIVLLAALDVI